MERPSPFPSLLPVFFGPFSGGRPFFPFPRSFRRYEPPLLRQNVLRSLRAAGGRGRSPLFFPSRSQGEQGDRSLSSFSVFEPNDLCLGQLAFPFFPCREHKEVLLLPPLPRSIRNRRSTPDFSNVAVCGPLNSSPPPSPVIFHGRVKETDLSPPLPSLFFPSKMWPSRETTAPFHPA